MSAIAEDSRPCSRRVATLIVAAALLAGCGPEQVRTQSRFLRVSHAALFVNADGEGQYVVELRSVRDVPPLSTLQLRFDHPQGAPWTVQRVVSAGQRRFRFSTPVLPGYEPGGRYAVRAELTSFDGSTRLDQLRQLVEATPVGEPRS